MGMIQSAVNQSLGTIGIAARLNPNFQQHVEFLSKKKDLERKIKALEIERGSGELTEEQRQQYENDIQDLNRQMFELKPNTLTYQQQSIIPRYNRRMAEAQAQAAEGGLSDEEEAQAQMAEYEALAAEYSDQTAQHNAQVAEQANNRALSNSRLKDEQANFSNDFRKRFMEGVNTMKGVRSVTTFGADTGSPYLRSRTVYTPGREEFK